MLKTNNIKYELMGMEKNIRYQQISFTFQNTQLNIIF